MNPHRYFCPHDHGHYQDRVECLDLSLVKPGAEIQKDVRNVKVETKADHPLAIYVGTDSNLRSRIENALKDQLAKYRAWREAYGDDNAPNQGLVTGSVRVMKSHDYCHFEICLGSSEPLTFLGVDNLRKSAARLADKAVDQYKKKKDALSMEDSYPTHVLRAAVKEIRLKPVGDWTEEDKATVKELGDREHAARYDYEDNPEDDQALAPPPPVAVPASSPTDPDFEVLPAATEKSPEDIPL